MPCLLMHAAGKIVEPYLQDLRPWELSGAGALGVQLHLCGALVPPLRAAPAVHVPPIARRLPSHPMPAAVLLWGAARLGYTPGPVLLRKLQDQAAAILREAPGSAEAFSPQVAAAAAGWLGVLTAWCICMQAQRLPLTLDHKCVCVQPFALLQEACMAAWALSVLQGQTPELWASALKFVSACPSASLDEARLLLFLCCAARVARIFRAGV